MQVKEAVPGTSGYSTTKMETPAYLTGTYTGSSGTAAYLANAVTPGVDVSTEHKTELLVLYSPQRRNHPYGIGTGRHIQEKMQAMQEAPSIIR